MAVLSSLNTAITGRCENVVGYLFAMRNGTSEGLRAIENQLFVLLQCVAACLFVKHTVCAALLNANKNSIAYFIIAIGHWCATRAF
jgi:hypothetical protein